jgi:hypothetical protein
MYHSGQQSGFHGVTRHQQTVCDNQVAVLTDVCGMTERAGLKFKVKGWDEYGDESVKVWNTEVFELITHGTIRIPTDRWTRGTDRDRRSVEFPWVFLDHKASGTTLLTSEVHVPAHRREKAQRVAGNQALKGFGEEFADLADRLSPQVRELTGDGNVDFRLKRNVEEFEDYLSPACLKILVPPSKTIRGLLGRRIELVAVHGFRPAEGLSMMPWLVGYDHRGAKRRVRTA